MAMQVNHLNQNENTLVQKFVQLESKSQQSKFLASDKTIESLTKQKQQFGNAEKFLQAAEMNSSISE